MNNKKRWAHNGAGKTGSRPFLEVSGSGMAPLSFERHYQPKNPNRWRVVLWAKRRSLARELIVECEEMITIEDMVTDLVPIVDEFMTEFGDLMLAQLDALRLEGKFADAYDLEGRAPRYGYTAYEIID